MDRPPFSLSSGTVLLQSEERLCGKKVNLQREDLEKSLGLFFQESLGQANPKESFLSVIGNILAHISKTDPVLQ